MDEADAINLSPPFTPLEWIRDFEWVTGCMQNEKTLHHVPIMAYFERTYGEQAQPRLRRVIAALRYVNLHRDDFAGGWLAINGPEGFAPRKLLLASLLVFYNGAQEDEVEKEWKVESIKNVARMILRPEEVQ